MTDASPAGRAARRRPPVSVSAPGGARPRIANYQSAMRFLFDRVNFERQRQTRATADQFKLDRMRALLEAMGNPHSALRCVHVAGTKGKGSTCEMTAACLEGCGYTVGIYTSPHLVDVRERIRINREMIPQPEFTRQMRRVAEAVEALDAELGEVSYFEVLTALGFGYFADQAVDVAVIEVGLGGRLDATNVITPEVSVVTAIGFDHMAILGDTLGKIAREKAGIFKPGVPAVTMPQAPEALASMKEVAQEVGAPLEVLGSDIEFSHWFGAGPGQAPMSRVSLTTPRVSFEHLPVPLKGQHQAFNCGLALAALDKLVERGFALPASGVASGLETTVVPGRFELALESPRLLLDGAHNPESIEALMKALGAYMAYDSMVMIFGCCADKDVESMLAKISMGADKVIFTKAADNPRSADPARLARLFTDLSGKMCQTAPDLREAINLAARAVARDDLICVTGSFYLVGEAKKLLQERAAGPKGGRARS